MAFVLAFSMCLFRHAVWRVLWFIPTLAFVSLVTFLFLSYVPDPTLDPKVAAALGETRVAELRRERFLDLPRCANTAPRDTRARATAAVAAIAEGGAAEADARKEFARLGGVALPHVIPLLDVLAPEP